jgi:hypothetical protein
MVKPTKGEYARYGGTPITNAPRVDEQGSRLRLDTAGLVRCANYSLGILIFEIATGSLDETITGKTTIVMATVLERVSRSEHPQEFKSVMNRVLTHLLAYEPSHRCYDLSITQNLLQPIQAEDLTLKRYGTFLQSEQICSC